MNKILNVNLGGYAFTIDENAYESLSVYLKTIHRHFEKSEGYEEITSDIEARMAEVIQEGLLNRPIVSIKDVEAAIGVMGTPEDFGAVSLDEPQPEAQNAFHAEAEGKIKKRFYRNPEDEIVAGVASGISAYFGFNDPIWIRILFVVFTITGGLAIPLYLVLWVILPKAETSADRLAMRGEQINVSTIAKTIEEEMDHLSSKLSTLSAEVKKKVMLRKAEPSDDSFRKGFHC